MEWRISLSSCVIVICALQTVHAAINFKITPTSYNIDEPNRTPSITFECTPGSDFTDKYQTTIGRYSSNGGQQFIVQLQVTADQPVKGSGSLGQKAKNTEFDKTSFRLKFDFEEPTCDDAKYTYYCLCTGNVVNPGGGDPIPARPEDNTININLTANTRPSQIEMSAEKQRVRYTPGEEIIFTCRGLIGNAYEGLDNYDNIYKWEYRYTDTLSSWQGITTNVTVSGAPSSQANCQYRFESQYRYTVTALDSNKQIRCYVGSEDYSANFTINLEGDNPGNTGNVGSNGDPNNAGSNVGVIVGSVIGALVLIVIIIIIVYFVVFRKKRDGDVYDTGEGKNERPEMTDHVVYSTPASKQPNRGRENEALDEPQEKNPPKSYYANNYGQANPAMDDDDSYKHDRSYDDGNTEMRGGRNPYGSAV